MVEKYNSFVLFVACLGFSLYQQLTIKLIKGNNACITFLSHVHPFLFFPSPMQNPPVSQSTPNMQYHSPMLNQNMTPSNTNYGYNMQGVANPSVTATNVQPGTQYVNPNTLYQNQNLTSPQMQYPQQYQTNQQQMNLQQPNYNHQQNQQAVYHMQNMQNYPTEENPVPLQITNQQLATSQQQPNRQPIQPSYNQGKGENPMNNQLVNQQQAVLYGNSQPRMENAENPHPHMATPQTAASNYQQMVNNSSQMQQLLTHEAENTPQSSISNQQQVYNTQTAQQFQDQIPNISQKDMRYTPSSAGDDGTYNPYITTNQVMYQNTNNTNQLKTIPTASTNHPNTKQEEQMYQAQNALPQFRNFQNQALPNVIPANSPPPNVHHSSPNVTVNRPNIQAQPTASYSVPNTQMHAGQPTQMVPNQWAQPNMTHSLPNVPVPTGSNMQQAPPVASMHQMSYPVNQNMNNYGVQPPVQQLGMQPSAININRAATPVTPPQAYPLYPATNQQNQVGVQQSLPNMKPMREEQSFPNQNEQYYNPAVTQSQMSDFSPQTIQNIPSQQLPVHNTYSVQNNPIQTSYQQAHHRLPHTITVNQASVNVPPHMNQMQNLLQEGEQMLMTKPSQTLIQNQYENVGQAGDYANQPPRNQANNRFSYNQNERPINNQAKSVIKVQENEPINEDDSELKYGYPPQITK